MLTLDKIYQAAYTLKAVARKTDLLAAPNLGSDANLYLKAENLQVTGSFKVRGAYNKIAALTEEQKAEMKAKFEARKAKFMEKFDTDKDGQISDAEKEAIKAAHEARKAEMKAKFMEKFDTDKDGQISDAEKEAIKAEFGKCGPRRPHGPRHGKCCGPKCDKH